MEKILNILKRTRLVYRRSAPAVRGVMLCAIALSMAAVLTLNLTVAAAQERADALREQAAQLEESNRQLEESISALGSSESVKDIAREELGLVDPDTVIIEPKE